ncbi:PREDICTED: uncharacterized protein LOC106815334 [Priapulus caudatus]|uniref:Uncharacterized protein LOC106815334 n=1 Tax=Priapulus caudatus TaxID=37621 RepID=A0ABM1ESU3_PRICU|nr:PREDICTED: uncharacterized protein LOC106815334 [Priapulus caudatus]
MRRAFPYYKRFAGTVKSTPKRRPKSSCRQMHFKLCCLATNEEFSPDKEEECLLAKAGLGVKTIDILSDLSHEDFKATGESHFYRLKQSKSNWLLYRHCGHGLKSRLLEIPPGTPAV